MALGSPDGGRPEAFDRLLGRDQLALNMKARCELVLSSPMLAIGAGAFGLEQDILSFEQRAQIGRKLCKSGGIEAWRHAKEFISCDAPNEQNPAD